MGKLYTLKNDRRKVTTARQQVEVQRETFLFNTSLELMQQNTEIQKISDLMKADDEIIRLRTSIKNAAEVKLAVLPANSFLHPAPAIRDGLCLRITDRPVWKEQPISCLPRTAGKRPLYIERPGKSTLFRLPASGRTDPPERIAPERVAD